MISDAVYSEDYVEYIIEYNGDREVLMDLYQPYGLNIIDDRYAVAYQPFPAGYMESFSRLEYNLFPKVYGLMDDVGALEAIGVINIQQENILGLTGKGILLGIVDTGIDIFGSSFVRDGGKTKILAAWDQTVEKASTVGPKRHEYAHRHAQLFLLLKQICYRCHYVNLTVRICIRWNTIKTA